MHLVSFGCSFIYGNELKDCFAINGFTKPSVSTWPALIAKQFKLPYICNAKPGAGNLQIADQVFNRMNISDPDFYVIQWTWIDRFDYTTRFDEWKTIMPNHRDNVATVYHRDIHSQYRDKLTNLMTIKLVIDTLLQKGKKFYMTYMDDLLFDDSCHNSPTMSQLQHYIKPYLHNYEGMDFVKWSRLKGYEVTELWHPLEEAHQAAAELMLPNIKF